ncbi:MAG: hypothetical protein ABH835_03620 [Patescibacteria group bacterium]
MAAGPIKTDLDLNQLMESLGGRLENANIGNERSSREEPVLITVTLYWQHHIIYSTTVTVKFEVHDLGNGMLAFGEMQAVIPMSPTQHRADLFNRATKLANQISAWMIEVGATDDMRQRREASA